MSPSHSSPFRNKPCVWGKIRKNQRIRRTWSTARYLANIFLNTEIKQLYCQNQTIRGLFKKYRECWISSGYVFSSFEFFVALCWYSYLSLMPTSSAILNVQLICYSHFVLTCFDSSSIFTFSTKWIKEYVLYFVWKTKLSAWTHPNVDCGIRWSYIGPKQRLSVAQNVLRRPRRYDRQRAYRTPEHVNNNHWYI